MKLLVVLVGWWLAVFVSGAWARCSGSVKCAPYIDATDSCDFASGRYTVELCQEETNMCVPKDRACGDHPECVISDTCQKTGGGPVETACTGMYPMELDVLQALA